MVGFEDDIQCKLHCVFHTSDGIRRVRNAHEDNDSTVLTHNLQLHCFPLELNSPNLEVDANGADIALGVCVIGETQEQT